MGPHSSGVEHSLGKGEVESSNLSVGTINPFKMMQKYKKAERISVISVRYLLRHPSLIDRNVMASSASAYHGTVSKRRYAPGFLVPDITMIPTNIY